MSKPNSSYSFILHSTEHSLYNKSNSSKMINMHHFRSLYSVATVLLQPHQCKHQPCCYSKVSVVSSEIISIPYFVNISQLFWRLWWLATLKWPAQQTNKKLPFAQHEDIGTWGCTFPLIQNQHTRLGEWSGSWSSHLMLGKRALCTQWRQCGSRTQCLHFGEVNILLPQMGIKPRFLGSPAHSPVTLPTTSLLHFLKTV
jgi:hypothetical protein